VLKDEGAPGKALVKKNAPYPERDIEITDQVYLAAFYTALGQQPKEIAAELETTPATIYNYRRNKKFLALVRDLDAAAEIEPCLEVRLLVRQSTQAAAAAIEVLREQLSATLVVDGIDTGIPQTKTQQDAAIKLLENFGRLYAAQARAGGGGGGDGDNVVIVNVNPMAGVEIKKQEVIDG